MGIQKGQPLGGLGGGSMGVRLMVVDDHRLLAEALASALKLRGHRVLAAAAPAAGAAELVITRAPEVCLLGTATPAEPGMFDPVVRIKRERPQVAVLVLGPVPSPRGIAAAFAAGASGYVRHDERIEGVERAIMKARAGEVAVSPQLLQGAFSELLNPAAQPDDEGQRLLQLLTPREVEVLVRVADGEDTRLIAAGDGDRAQYGPYACAAGADEAGGRVETGGGGAGGPYGTAGPGGPGAAALTSWPGLLTRQLSSDRGAGVPVNSGSAPVSRHPFTAPVHDLSSHIGGCGFMI